MKLWRYIDTEVSIDITYMYQYIISNEAFAEMRESRFMRVIMHALLKSCLQESGIILKMRCEYGISCT
jgi:hypothetical protein